MNTTKIETKIPFLEASKFINHLTDGQVWRYDSICARRYKLKCSFLGRWIDVVEENATNTSAFTTMWNVEIFVAPLFESAKKKIIRIRLELGLIISPYYYKLLTLDNKSHRVHHRRLSMRCGNAPHPVHWNSMVLDRCHRQTTIAFRLSSNLPLRNNDNWNGWSAPTGFVDEWLHWHRRQRMATLRRPVFYHVNAFVVQLLLAIGPKPPKY